MSQGLLGMDVDAARSLATRLDRWGMGVGQIARLIHYGEALSELSTGALGLLNGIGTSGPAMAAAIRNSADTLESFSINMGSPFTVSGLVDDVLSFRGSDNDPILDERMGRLRDYVRSFTDSDAEADALVLQLLRADRPLDVRFRDTDEVAAAWVEVQRLNELEATGAISSNDPAIDAASRDLRAALADHATTETEGHDLMAAFVDPGNAGVAAAVLIASVLTGHGTDVVERAHRGQLDYDVADGLMKFERVDELTAMVAGDGQYVSPEAADQILLAREQLLSELVGGDALTIAVMNEQLANGVAALDAYAGVDEQVQAMIDAEHERRVGVYIEAFGLDQATAEVRVVEAAAIEAELIESGVSMTDAVNTAAAIAGGELDLEAVEDAADRFDLSLPAATAAVAQARTYELTIDQQQAFVGFREHFSLFDTARGGSADGIASVQDLRYVQEHPEEFPAEAVAIAGLLLASPGLLNRLDDAADNDEVIGHEPFGSTGASDLKFSLSDLDGFELKQSVNFLLSDHIDAIDVAGQDFDPSKIDGTLSKHDFEDYLAQADELDLTQAEINAIQTVIDADWYDKNFWDEHGATMAFAAGVVAGGAVVVLSGGTGAPLLVMAMGAGAGAGATTTVVGNLINGDDWHEDLVTGTVAGASGGAFAVGFQPSSSSLAVKVLGHTANTASLVDAGVADPLFEQVGFSEDTIDGIHGNARKINYLAGAGAMYHSATQLHRVTADGSRLLATVDDSLRVLPVNSADLADEALVRGTAFGLDLAGDRLDGD